MTPEQLAEIEARSNAATEGPWHKEKDCGETGFTVMSPRENPRVGVAFYTSDYDAIFIAHARTDITTLIAAVREKDKLYVSALADLVSANSTIYDQNARIAELEKHIVSLGEQIEELENDLSGSDA